MYYLGDYTFFIVLGHNQLCSVIIPNSALRKHSWQAPGSYGIPEIKPGLISDRPHIRQMPYSCIISLALEIIFFHT